MAKVLLSKEEALERIKKTKKLSETKTYQEKTITDTSYLGKKDNKKNNTAAKYTLKKSDMTDKNDLFVPDSPGAIKLVDSAKNAKAAALSSNAAADRLFKPDDGIDINDIYANPYKYDYDTLLRYGAVDPKGSDNSGTFGSALKEYNENKNKFVKKYAEKIADEKFNLDDLAADEQSAFTWVSDDIEDAVSDALKEKKKATVYENYTPVWGTSKERYEVERESNPDLPAWGSYEYFKNKYSEIEPLMKEMQSDPDYQNMEKRDWAEQWDKNHLWTPNPDMITESARLSQKFKRGEQITDEYRQILDMLELYETPEIYLDKYGNVDYKKGSLAEEENMDKYEAIFDVSMPFGDDFDQDMVKLQKDKEKYNLAYQNKKAYDYYGENKDKEYNDTLFGRASGNAKIGAINLKRNDTGYESYKSYSEDIRAAQIYELLAERIRNQNRNTFINETKFQEGLASAAQYAPQGFAQLKRQVAGGLAGALLGLTVSEGNVAVARQTANIGASAASAAYIFKQTAGGMYVDLLESSELSVEDAHILAKNEALSEAVIEFGLEAAVGAIWNATGGKAVNKGTAAITKKLTQKGISQKGARIAVKAATRAGAFVIDDLGEGVEEWIQQGMEITAKRYANSGKTANTFEILTNSFDFTQYTEEDFKEMNQSFLSALVIGISSAGAHGAASQILGKTSNALILKKASNAVDTNILGETILSQQNSEDLILTAVAMGSQSNERKTRNLAGKISAQFNDGESIKPNDIGTLFKNVFSEEANAFKNENKSSKEYAHTPEQLKVMREYERAVDKNILNFVEYAENAKDDNRSSFTISKVSDRSAEDIKSLTGVDVSGYAHSLKANTVRHIIEGHGKNGTTDNSMADNKDIARIKYVLDNYDNVELLHNTSKEFRDKNQKPAPMIRISKRVDGTYYIVEAVPDTKRHELAIVSAYKNKATEQQTEDVQAPSWNARDDSADAVSVGEPSDTVNENNTSPISRVNTESPTNSNISQSGGNVKVKQPRSAYGSFVPVPQSEWVDSFGPHGQRVVSNMNPDVRNIGSFQKAVSDFYELGYLGMEFDKAYDGIKNFDYGNVLSELEARRAHQAGMKDGARIRGGGVIADKAARAQIGENTVRNLNNIAKKLRVTIEFVKTLGDSNGLYQNGKIYIALDAEDPYIVVASHEITHHMQALSKKAYEKFRNMAVRYEAKTAKMSSADLVDAKRNAYAEHGRAISRSEALDEIAADFTQKVFSNNEQLESFLKRIAAENPENRGVLKKFSDSIRAVLKAIGEHIPHKDKITLEETIKRFDEAFKAAEKNAGTGKETLSAGQVKYSVKMDYKHQVDLALEGKLKSNLSVYVGKTSNLLKKCGLPDLVMLMNQSHMRDMNHPKSKDNIHWHGLDKELIKQIPEQLKNPVMIYDSISDDNSENSVCVVTKLKDGDQLPVIVSIRANSDVNNKYLDISLAEVKTDNSNFVTSAYGKDNFFNHINEVIERDALLYANKSKTLKLFSDKGLQLPNRLNSLGFGNIIHQSRNIVNNNYTQNTKNNSSDNSKASLKGTSNEVIIENKRLKEENERLRRQFETTSQKVIPGNTLKKFADEIRTLTSSKADKEQVRKDITEIYDLIRKGAPYEQIRDRAAAMADTLIESSEIKDDGLYQKYRNLRTTVRNRKIKITDEIKQAFGGEFESFRKSNMGGMVFSYEGESLDAIYEDLSLEYPEFFDYETESDPKLQLERISEVLSSLKPTYENPYSSGMARAKEQIANKILEDIAYYSPTGKKTFADKKAQQLENERNKHKDALKEAIQKTIDRETRKREEKVKTVAQRYIDRIAKEDERRKRAVTIGKIKNAQLRLENKLNNPTNTRHVPTRLLPTVEALCETMKSMADLRQSENFDGGRLASALEDFRGKYYVMLKEVKSGDAKAYTSLIIDDEFDYILDDAIDSLKEEIKLSDENRVKNISPGALNKFYTCVKEIERLISSANKLIDSELNLGVMETAEKIIKENKRVRTTDYVLRQKGSKWIEDYLSPEHFFHKLGDTAEKVYKELRQKGGNRQIKNTERCIEMVREIDGIKKLSKLKDEKIYSVRLESGEKIKISNMQIMELYILYKQTGPKGARNNILNGGISVSETKIKNGKTVEHHTPVKVTGADVENLISRLSDTEIKVAEKMVGFMPEFAKWGNEVTQKLYGYDKFVMKDNYWPKTVDRSQSGALGALKKPRSVENIRSGIARVENSLPVELGNALETFSRYGYEMAYYNAYAVPLSNFKRVMNFSLDGLSVQDTLKTRFSKNTADYISEFIKMINGGAEDAYITGLEKLLNTSVRNFKKAAVGLSMSTTLKQPLSYIRAANEINPIYLAAPTNLKRADIDAMHEYAPISLWKEWGFFGDNIGPSIETLITGGNVTDKITNATMYLAGKMDDFTWRRLWNACLLETAKTTNLEKGSREFYTHAGERFSDIVYRTQVVDSVFQKPMFLNKTVSRAIGVFTPFMNEPVTAFNTIYTAARDVADGRQGAKGKFVKAVLSHAIQCALEVGVGELIAWLVAGRKNGTEDDENKWTELLKEYACNLVSITPFVNTLTSVAEGYSTDRIDLEAVKDIVNWSQKKDKYSPTAYITQLLGYIGQLGQGLPVAQTKKDILAIARTVQRCLPADKSVGAEYFVAKQIYNIKTNPTVFRELLFEAYIAGDEELYDKIKSDLMNTGEAAYTALKINNTLKNKYADYLKKNPGFEPSFYVRWNNGTSLKEVEETETDPTKNDYINSLSAADEDKFEDESIEMTEKILAPIQEELGNLENSTYNSVIGDVVEYSEAVTLQDVTNGQYTPSEKWIANAEDIAASLNIGISEYIVYKAKYGYNTIASSKLQSAVDEGMPIDEYVPLRKYYNALTTVRNSSGKIIKNKPDQMRGYLTAQGYSQQKVEWILSLVKD